MPRYYFHTHSETSAIDTEGEDLLDEKAARVFMVRLASDIIKSEACCIAEGKYWRIEATDETGRLIYCFSLLPLNPRDFPEGAIRTFPF